MQVQLYKNSGRAEDKGETTLTPVGIRDGLIRYQLNPEIRDPENRDIGMGVGVYKIAEIRKWIVEGSLPPEGGRRVMSLMIDVSYNDGRVHHMPIACEYLGQ